MSTELTKPFEQTNRSAGAEVKDRVADIASNVRDKAGQMADTVSEKLGQSRESAADGLAWAASKIHANPDSVPGGTAVGDVTNGIADGMGSAADYLRQSGLNKMGKDVMDVCRRYPTQSFVAALAVGFLIGRSRRS